jgi:sugar phosphate isomerase/epimerase
MKVGIQTIAWGMRDPINTMLPRMLTEIRRAGYEGLELFQRADTHPDFVVEQLAKNKLSLIGASGGAFSDRVQFVRKYRAFAPTKPSPYIYTDEWPVTEAEDALKSGLTVAIHPHMFKPIQTVAEAMVLLDKYSHWRTKGGEPVALHLLPDSAHQQIAGEPILRVLTKHYDRIRAVHFKDWTPEFGRSYQFYAQGFVALGDGDVPLEEAIEFLRSRNFDGWLIVEQDITDNPFEAALKCRTWLGDRGI